MVENNRGVAFAQMGRLDDAERAFKSSIELRSEVFRDDPQMSSALLNLAKLHASRGDDAGGLAHAERALLAARALLRTRPRHHGTDGRGPRPTSPSNGQPPARRRSCTAKPPQRTSALRHGTTRTTTRTCCSWVRLLTLEDRYDEAVENLARSAQLQQRAQRNAGPHYCETLTALADAHFWSEDYADAMDAARQAIAAHKAQKGVGLGNVADSHFQLGRAALFAGDYDVATSHLQQALEAGASDDSACRMRLAEAHVAAGRFEDARATLDALCDDCELPQWVQQRRDEAHAAIASGTATAPRRPSPAPPD